MHKVAIFGGTGYTGAELIRLFRGTRAYEVHKVFASERTPAQPLAQLHPQFAGSPLQVEPWLDDLSAVADCDLALLALPHEVSAGLAPLLARHGLAVFDLSGAYRLPNLASVNEWYGFTHPAPELLGQVPYMLAGSALGEVKEAPGIYAIPGCYPTAATLSLLPALSADWFPATATPVVQGMSGASGAGRQAKQSLSFCELSLRPYSLGTHRHTPEISQNLQRNCLFTPHVGPWSRGLITTTTVKLTEPVSAAQVRACYADFYAAQPFIQWRDTPPAVNDVMGTPYAHIHACVQGDHLIAVGAIDNLLKGAASQALEAVNLVFGLPATHGLEAWQ